MTLPSVGFIGLGLMGRPMAGRLLKAGFPVTVFNRSRPAIEALAAEGAGLAESPAHVGRTSQIVITMLPDAPDVEGVLDGDAGVMAHAVPGTLVIDMSTIAPGAARRLHDRARAGGLRMLDAPVSGGDTGAQAGTLSIMVGGDAAEFESARPVFEAMGKTIVHCGPAGAGQLVKACNQLLAALVLDAISEALVFAEQARVDPQVMMQVLQGGLAHTRLMEVKGPRMAKREFTPPGFRAALHLKDLRIVEDEAKQMGITLPLSAKVKELFQALVDRGDGGLDNSAVLLMVDALAAAQRP
jgi:2-hydroxy-3-oxopropionate reductase